MKPKSQKIKLPSERDTRLLRCIALSAVIVTYGDGKRRPTRYCYEGGELSPGAFTRLTRNGWLIVDKHDSLLGDLPQVYRARKPPVVI